MFYVPSDRMRAAGSLGSVCRSGADRLGHSRSKEKKDLAQLADKVDCDDEAIKSASAQLQGRLNGTTTTTGGDLVPVTLWVKRRGREQDCD